jgi:hypothetical protein
MFVLAKARINKIKLLLTDGVKIEQNQWPNGGFADEYNYKLQRL